MRNVLVSIILFALSDVVRARLPGAAEADAAGRIVFRAQRPGRVAGQRQRTGFVREKTKRVIAALPENATNREQIAAAVDAYKPRFRQKSVGMVTQPHCASFD